jgi:hypothetical protein
MFTHRPFYPNEMASELASSIAKVNMQANAHNCIIHSKAAMWYVKPLALGFIGIRAHSSGGETKHIPNYDNIND